MFLLVCSHVWMQSLWMVWVQLRGWRFSGSTWFWHIRQSFRTPAAGGGGAAALCRGRVGLWMGPGGAGLLMGPGADLSLWASLKPTCSMTSSMDIPASVPRELFTCCSRVVSCALLHWGNREPSRSRTFSSLSVGGAVGGGGEGTTGGDGHRLGGGVTFSEVAARGGNWCWGSRTGWKGGAARGGGKYMGGGG